MKNTSNKFSKLNHKDLEELIIYILKKELKYRNNINIEDNITFGIEIEYEGLLKKIINRKVRNNYPDWRVKDDESLIMGSEITSPIMTDEIKYWKQLKEICEILKKRHAIMDENAAGHIHVGAHIIGKNIENWRKFIKTYTIYEDILFRFLYGNQTNARKRILDYSRPIADLIINRLEILNSIEDIKEIKKIMPPYNKEQAVNFMNINTMNINKVFEKNTIEFRSPNGSADEIVCQNNINALIKLIINSKEIDEEFLNYKLKDRASVEKIYTYNEVYLKKALEFADLIFEDDIDKIYFLKQYIKDFKESSNLPFEKKYKRR